MDGHLISSFSSIVRQIRADRLLEIDPPLLLELKDQNRRKRLGDRGDLIFRLTGIRSLEGYVRQPKALREADLPLLLYQDGPAEVVLLRVGGDEVVGRCRLCARALGQQQRDD